MFFYCVRIFLWLIILTPALDTRYTSRSLVERYNEMNSPNGNRFPPAMASRIQAATTAAQMHPFLLRCEPPCSASMVDCSVDENFSIPGSYVRLRVTGTSPSSAAALESSRLARNQLSATEAACRSSRTLEGICQALHASVPTIRARMSAPSNLLVLDGSWESNALASAIQRRRDVPSTDRDRWMCPNTSRRRATIKARWHLKHILSIGSKLNFPRGHRRDRCISFSSPNQFASGARIDIFWPWIKKIGDCFGIAMCGDTWRISQNRRWYKYSMRDKIYANAFQRLYRSSLKEGP